MVEFPSKQLEILEAAMRIGGVLALILNENLGGNPTSGGRGVDKGLSLILTILMMI